MRTMGSAGSMPLWAWALSRPGRLSKPARKTSRAVTVHFQTWSRMIGLPPWSVPRPTRDSGWRVRRT